MDLQAKMLLICIAEPPRDADDQAVARGKFRYDRFLKSVDSAMTGDSNAAMAELLDRVDKDESSRWRSTRKTARARRRNSW